MAMLDVVDDYGDYWCLQFGACQFNKRDGMQYVIWRVLKGPPFLQTNGARYDVIPTPIFTEWFQ